MPDELLTSYCSAFREIVVQFNADVADGMPWKFIPTQREVLSFSACVCCVNMCLNKLFD